MTEENEKTIDKAEEKAEEKPSVLGKFNSVEALAHAYGELEAEFTRRSQRLRELEKRNNPSEEESVRAECGSEELYRTVMQNESVRARVIGEYLDSLKGVPLMTGAGQGVSVPVRKPGSIADAGALALDYLKNVKEKKLW